MCRKKQGERNTSRKINYEQQLLDILKEKSEHIDEDKTFLLSLLPGFKKIGRWPEVLGEDGNDGNYEESKKYGVLATVCTTVMKNDYSDFFNVPNKTIMSKMCIKLRQKFSFTLMSLLTFRLVARTFSFWYLEM